MAAAVVVVEGGGGRGWRRVLEAEGDAVSSLYPQCIRTVSLQKEVSAESFLQRKVVGGGGGGGGGGWWW